MRKILLTALVPVLGACQQAAAAPPPDLNELKQMSERFIRTPLKVDTSTLSLGDRKALGKLIEAARLLNPLFMQQFWSGDTALYQRLQKDSTSLGKVRLHYFWLNKGPWSAIDEHRAFLPDVPATKPPGANFYPEDMTKEEFEVWAKTLDAESRAAAEGFFTVIRRSPQQKLTFVPYSVEYRADLGRVAALLREAAALTDNVSLRRFLTARADAFATNDYVESDIAWMDLDAPLDITFGPYETYNDELFGYKAAFEAYINVRDDKESAKLAFFGDHLQEVENNLPEAPQFRNAKLGALAPIRVVNEVFNAGDAAHGVQTAAYNLPNDEAVVQQKGAKRVMLKNVQEAKFAAILTPISKIVLRGEDQTDVNFNLFFTHIVAHELSHGLGPHQIHVAGRDTSPRAELKEAYGPIEEAKADVTGLFTLQFLMSQSDKEPAAAETLPHGPTAERQLYTTYLASSFRTLRFGMQEAHAKGAAMQVNYLLDKGAYVSNNDGTFNVDFGKIHDAVRDLDHDLLTLEATGDYAGAKKMLADLSVIRPNVQRALDRLKSLPTDIEPVFVSADTQ
ncbi:MAG TPA: hypothetical protein VHZ99_13155 [Steroidobacteraceae bacterium]|jgi:hypothetical protein|nr:hypothetical protein [Steroidobacteraceae bacterium]